TRFQIDAVDSRIRDLLFAPQARQVGCYYGGMGADLLKHWFDAFDVQTGQRVCRVEMGKSRLGQHMDFSPDGARVADQEADPVEGQAITVWSLPDANVLLPEWHPHPPPPQPPPEQPRRGP